MLNTHNIKQGTIKMWAWVGNIKTVLGIIIMSGTVLWKAAELYTEQTRRLGTLEQQFVKKSTDQDIKLEGIQATQMQILLDIARLQTTLGERYGRRN